MDSSINKLSTKLCLLYLDKQTKLLINPVLNKLTSIHIDIVKSRISGERNNNISPFLFSIQFVAFHELRRNFSFGKWKTSMDIYTKDESLFRLSQKKYGASKLSKTFIHCVSLFFPVYLVKYLKLPKIIVLFQYWNCSFQLQRNVTSEETG